MQRLHVFVDEYGDPHLDTSKPGVSSAYIVAAVCVRADVLDRVRSEAAVLRRRLFQSGEMKSSAIGSNDRRRIDVLRNLSGLDTFVVALCAQKTRMRPDSGLQYKKSFIKYFARSMYERLTKYADDMVVVADEHGSPEFQEEFGRYLEGHFRSDLFRKVRFDFAKSSDEVLLQVADIFAGSLARVHDPGRIAENASEISRLVAHRVSTTLWPSGLEEGFAPIEQYSDEADERVRRFCVGQARSYVERASYDPDDRDGMARVAFLEVLLASHSMAGTGEFVKTGVLLREIGLRLGESITEHRFRSAVVAKLRDADVVISSCTKGYKIPGSVSDIREFAAFANSQIPPMVARLARARKGVREATLGEVDILAGEDLAQLKSLVESQAA